MRVDPYTKVFDGLATENAVCTSQSIVAEPLDPVPVIVIITAAAQEPRRPSRHRTPLSACDMPGAAEDFSC